MASKQLNVLLILLISLLSSSFAFKIQPRIYKGKSSEPNQFPFFAFLELNSERGIRVCGGSIISNEWILTAAHCLEDVEFMDINLGLHSYYEDKERTRYRVEKSGLYMHPEYNTSFNSTHDIGLIHLSERINFTSRIQQVKLSIQKNHRLGSVDVIAVGNGRTGDYEFRTPNFVQYALMRTIPMEECKKYFRELREHESTVFCSVSDVGSSICVGDSGSGVIRKGDYTLIGISSFANADSCESGKPQAFTDVSLYFDWILEVTGLKF